MSKINVAEIKVGDKVCYQPEHFGPNEYENGIVKEIPNHTFKYLRVVFNCAGDWDNFKDYTSALTSIDHLKVGWRHDSE